MAASDPTSRRAFFANIAMGVTAALGLGALAERMLAFLYPVVSPEQRVEYPVARVEDVPKNGGLVAHSPAGHVALEDDAGQLRAFSAVCTHLGCIIRWQPGDGHVWFCPCHRGTYDRSGRVVSGPPPRPLDALPVTVRDGLVYVTLRVRPPVSLPEDTPS